MQLLTLLLALLGPAANPTVVAQSLFGGLPIDGIHCDSEEGSVEHVHTQLQLFNRGHAVTVPAQIGIPLTFLSFSRDFESQADFLGVQYMYHAGYDPQAFITIFEKLENLQKTKPNLFAKAFSTHPQTPDRIEATQKEIAAILPPRDEYVVTTSEFDDVKARLARIENKRQLKDGGNSNQPTLRRANTSNNDPNNPNAQQGDDRPTLQRRNDPN